MKLKFKLVAICLLLVAGVSSQERLEPGFSPYVDAKGNISRPRQYRESWSHLGTFFVIGESQSSHSMHSVYTERENLDAYNETGAWPDGAVLVKEVMTTAGDQLTTGAANWAAEPDVWFVTVKDAEGRFPENPLWGEGWGWALFKADAPEVQVSTNYKQDCLNCHIPARETDWVYVQGYPSIHKRPMTETASPSRVMMAAAESVRVETGSSDRGAATFRQVCGICHSLKAGRVKVGPSLATIALQRKLPSGVDASAENLLRQINNGGGGMPAFAAHLDKQAKADLVAFLLDPN